MEAKFNKPLHCYFIRRVRQSGLNRGFRGLILRHFPLQAPRMSSPGKEASVTAQRPSDVEAGVQSVNKGWLYKRIKIGSWKGTYYASPLTQVILVSFICFLCPGMSNALSVLIHSLMRGLEFVLDSNSL